MRRNDYLPYHDGNVIELYHNDIILYTNIVIIILDTILLSINIVVCQSNQTRKPMARRVCDWLRIETLYIMTLCILQYYVSL